MSNCWRCLSFSRMEGLYCSQLQPASSSLKCSTSTAAIHKRRSAFSRKKSSSSSKRASFDPCCAKPFPPHVSSFAMVRLLPSGQRLMVSVSFFEQSYHETLFGATPFKKWYCISFHFCAFYAPFQTPCGSAIRCRLFLAKKHPRAAASLQLRSAFLVFVIRCGRSAQRSARQWRHICRPHRRTPCRCPPGPAVPPAHSGG